MHIYFRMDFLFFVCDWIDSHVGNTSKNDFIGDFSQIHIQQFLGMAVG